MESHQEKKVLIFVHGLFGSNLVHKQTGELAWLSVSTASKSLLRGNNGHTRVASRTTWSEDGMTQDMDDFEPISAVTLFTKPWDDWCASLDPDVVDVRYFLWDWRRPIEETCERLRNWILRQGLSKDNRAVLTTYSTGALFAWPIVNQHPELFSGWLNIGGAIGAGNFILNDFCHGWYKGKFCLLDAETQFTISSLYSFFATQGEPTGSSNGDYLWVNKETGKEIDLGDIFDWKTWRKNSLGIYHARKCEGREVTTAEEIHLKNALNAAKRFRQTHFVREGVSSFDDPAFLLHPKTAYDHLDIVLFGSNARDDTHCGWYYNGTNVEIGSDKVVGNGDGTIMTWAWKVVPGGLSPKIVLCDNKKLVHVELMTDQKAQELAAGMLGIDFVPASTTKVSKVFLFIIITAGVLLTLIWLSF